MRAMDSFNEIDTKTFYVPNYFSAIAPSILHDDMLPDECRGTTRPRLAASTQVRLLSPS